MENIEFKGQRSIVEHSLLMSLRDGDMNKICEKEGLEVE